MLALRDTSKASFEVKFNDEIIIKPTLYPVIVCILLSRIIRIYIYSKKYWPYFKNFIS